MYQSISTSFFYVMLVLFYFYYFLKKHLFTDQGLEVDDLIVQFGSLTCKNYTGLPMIGSLVQNSKEVGFQKYLWWKSLMNISMLEGFTSFGIIGAMTLNFFNFWKLTITITFL